MLARRQISELRSGFRGFVAAFFDFPGVFKAFSLLKTQYGQAFQIPREADQRPFATDFRQAAQRELTKSHDRLDDSEDRFDRLLA